MSGSDLYTGTLDVLILQALLEGKRHGYAIGQWIRRRSHEVLNVKEGVLYPALHRLEHKGLVRPSWGKTETGRRARFYALTKEGQAHLRTERDKLAAHSAAVLAMLESPRSS
jgi:PadR family transcriptional regulator PadR